MSRLNLEELDAVWVSEAIGTLTFFFTPGESKKDKKGNVSYDKKKDGKIVVPEQYLQISRSEEVGKQTLTFFLNDEKVASFEFTSKGIDFIPTAKWSQPKMYICIPTDRTFEDIIAETLSGVFKQWLQSQRFENYLENQAADSTYTVEFVDLILLLFAYLSNRDKVNDKGNIEIIQKGVNLEAVGHSYLTLRTKLHNSSPRTKKLFPIRPLLFPAVETTTTIQSNETEPTVEIVLGEPEKVANTILEPLADTIEVNSVESEDKVDEEQSTQPKNKKK